MPPASAFRQEAVGGREWGKGDVELCWRPYSAEV